MPQSRHQLADTMAEDDLDSTLARIRAAIKQRVNGLPMHGDFIESCCAAPPASALA